jgi:hypothetical protein
LIYDSQARRALGEPQGIKAYYDKWLGEFAKVGAQIDAACAALPSVHEYCIRPHQISPSDIQDLASNPWFKERVFDVYLWNKGN